MMSSVSPGPPPPDPVYTLRPHAGDVTDLAFTRTPQESLIVGTGGGQLSIWDLHSKRALWTESLESPIISVNTLPGTNYVLSQSRDCVVSAWDIERQCKLSSMVIDRAGFCKLAVLDSIEGQSGSTFNANCVCVAQSQFGKINIYDCQSQQLIATLKAEQPDKRGICMCVAMFSDQPSGVVYVLGGFEDGSVLLWDTRECTKELASVKLFPEPVMCLAMDNVRKAIIAGSATNTIEKVAINISDENVFQRGYSVEVRNTGLASVAVRSDSKIFCTGGWDGRIRVFGWKKGTPLAILNYHSGPVNCCTFLPTSISTAHSSVMVCGSKDERISLWKIY